MWTVLKLTSLRFLLIYFDHTVGTQRHDLPLITAYTSKCKLLVV